MLFNSFNFFIFLPVVFFLYWFVINKSLKIQNIFLLVASYFFYAFWDWRFLFLLIFSTLLDFITATKISDANNLKHKKYWFLLGVIINLGFLGFFKYCNFFIDSFANAMALVGLKANTHSLNIILPVGISFYTFHGLSYLIDAYRNRIKPEKNFIDYAVFVCFFPLLVAGPIERATHLLPQIKRKRAFSLDMFNEGIVQIIVGLFRKIVIADTLAIIVDSIYENAETHNTTSIIIATVFYAFQIYFDFAGYSDIAIGTGKLLGFSLLKNFNFPYFSKSLTDFWRRWHISLSSWLKDYLYIELGGNRNGALKTYRNLMLTMLLGGLWHGSNGTFIVWGGIHGLVLGIEKFVHAKSYFGFLNRFSFLGYITTFLVVLFAWIFFRSPNLHTAFVIIANIAKLDFGLPFIGNTNVFANALLVLFIGFGFDVFLFTKNIELSFLGSTMGFIKRVLFISTVLLLTFLFYSDSTNFIYFQF